MPPSGDDAISAERFHNIPGVKIRDLLDAGARFEPNSGQWVFPDGSRGQFATMLRNGGITDVVFVTLYPR